MIPAQAVPWPTASIGSSGDDRRVLAVELDPDALAQRAADRRVVALDPRVDDRDGHAVAVAGAERPRPVDPVEGREPARGRRGARPRTARSRPAGRLGVIGAPALAAASAPLRAADEDREEVADEVELAGIGGPEQGDLVGERPQRVVAVGVERRATAARDDSLDVGGRGAVVRRPRGRARSRRRGVALDAAAPDRDRRLPGEDRRELDVAQVERRRRRACRGPRGRRGSPSSSTSGTAISERGT